MTASSIFLPLNDLPSHLVAVVDLSAAAQARDPHHPAQDRHVGEEVEWVAQEDGLGVGDGVHDGMEGNCSGFLFYFPKEGERVDIICIFQQSVPDVTDGQTIEKVHQDDHYEEDEGEEVKIAERHEAALLVYGNIAELQFSHKHGQRFHKCEEGTVEERLEFILLLLSSCCVSGIILVLS